ncbi:SubName: Full=Uncharacterized protein {ECO:0000313/EMBL:CCA75399.1} [Serendipita indica DSM 11827]|nr:SubName: Full=Uncharacterized protein {ECO:0000313/EMBL:CCA75399.1} [Serendipita indica DSM 11827]
MNEHPLEHQIPALVDICKMTNVVQRNVDTIPLVDGGGDDDCSSSSSSVAIATPLLAGALDLMLQVDNEPTLSSVPMVRSGGMLDNAHTPAPLPIPAVDTLKETTIASPPLSATDPLPVPDGPTPPTVFTDTADSAQMDKDEEEAENEQLRIDLEHALAMDALSEANAAFRSSSPFPQYAVNTEFPLPILSKFGVRDRIQGGTLPLGDLGCHGHALVGSYMKSIAVRPLPPLVRTLLNPEYRNLYQPALPGGSSMSSYEYDGSDMDNFSEYDVNYLDMDPSNKIPIVKLHACVSAVLRGRIVLPLVMEDYCLLFGQWLETDSMLVDDLDTLFGVCI